MPAYIRLVGLEKRYIVATVATAPTTRSEHRRYREAHGIECLFSGFLFAAAVPAVVAGQCYEIALRDPISCHGDTLSAVPPELPSELRGFCIRLRRFDTSSTLSEIDTRVTPPDTTMALPSCVE